MKRVPSCPRDLEKQGPLTSSAKKLRQVWPLAKLGLAAAQNTTIIGLGYKSRKEAEACCFDPACPPARLTREQVISIVASNFHRKFGISSEDAKTIASQIGLGAFQICQQPTKKLSPLVLPGPLLELVPPFSFSVGQNGSTLIHSLILKHLSAFEAGELADMGQEQAQKIITDSTCSLIAAVRDYGVIPKGIELLPLFNSTGVFRGNTLYNPMIQGICAFITPDAHIFEFIAKLIINRPTWNRFCQIKEPGAGKGATISGRLDGGMIFNAGEWKAPLPENAYQYVYDGAEQLYRLKPGKELNTQALALALSGEAHPLVKISDLIPLPKITLDDGRYPSGDPFELPTKKIVEHGKLCARTHETDRICGPMFYERNVMYLSLIEWLTVADVPDVLMATVDVPENDFNEPVSFTDIDALPKNSLRMHYHLGKGLQKAEEMAYQHLDSVSGVTELVKFLINAVTPNDFASLTTSVMGRDKRFLHMLDKDVEPLIRSQLKVDGEAVQALYPGLAAYDTNSLGYALNAYRTADERPSATHRSGPPSTSVERVDFLTHLALSAVCEPSTHALPLRIAPRSRACLFDAVLSSANQSSKKVETDARAIDDFIRRHDAQTSLIQSVKTWRAAEAEKRMKARSLNLLAVGEALPTHIPFAEK